MSVPRHSGVVTQFDDAVGLGLVRTASGDEFLFHCVSIADGTRTIDIGAVVSFSLLAKFGHYEADDLRPA